MSSRAAPRAATWLLERVGGRSRFDPLIGDLVEQFEQGHSRLWYWRQALGTLAVDLVRTLRLYGFSFSAAVATGCALIWLLDAGYPYASQPLHASLAAVSRHPWSAQAVRRVVGMLMCGSLADALIFVTVWVVTRIHRSHPRTVLSVFAAAVTVRYLPGLARLVIHAVTDPRFTASLVSRHLDLMMPVALQALYILAAGLWVVRKPRLTGLERLTCFVAILAASLCVLAELARAAGLVGEITDSLHEQYVFDVLNIASVGYLVLLLWPPTPAPGMSLRRAEVVKAQ
ncbi:MAG TPA: hypothetical protein VIY90_19005 [Steroidobacteraceae bacterium]